MAETMTATPLRVSRLATNPILSTFMLRSSLEKLRPLERLVRTMSPSRTSTLRPLSLSSCSTISLMVVLPAPERPVNHNVKPRWSCAPFSIHRLLSVLVSVASCEARSLHPERHPFRAVTLLGREPHAKSPAGAESPSRTQADGYIQRSPAASLGGGLQYRL